MRHTTKIPLDIGGVILMTYDSAEKDFERELGQSLLDAGGLR